MSKHVIDRAGTNGNARIARYTDLERRERLFGPHPNVEKLRRRARPLSEIALSRAFLKIDRQAE